MSATSAILHLKSTRRMISKLKSAVPSDFEPEILPVFRSEFSVENTEPLDTDDTVITIRDDREPCTKHTVPSGTKPKNLEICPIYNSEVKVFPTFKPEGPLEVTIFKKNRCLLKWKGNVEPLEGYSGDFGPVIGYQIEKCDLAWRQWNLVEKTRNNFSTVKGFARGHEYKFRVKAFNELGESDPLEADGSVIASTVKSEVLSDTEPETTTMLVYNSEVKVVPMIKLKGPLKVVTIRTNRCSIIWDGNLEPVEGCSDDFGPIIGYRVEKCTLQKRCWTLVTKMTTNTFANFPLKPEHEYKFRVKALNKHGESDPLVTEGTVTAMDDRCSCPKNTVPSVTKPKNLEIRPIYNSEVKVLPTFKPEGPLEVTIFKKNRCLLKWKGNVEPLEGYSGDFGPVIGYQIEKCDLAWRQWTLVENTRNNFSIVKGFARWHEYKFRVKAFNELGESDPLEADGTVIAMKYEVLSGTELETSTMLVYSSEVKVVPMIKLKGPLKVVTMHTNRCSIIWDGNLEPLEGCSDDFGPIIGYRVEEFTLQKRCWTLVTKMTTNTFANFALKPEHEYKFRVKALNKFGESDPLETEGTVTLVTAVDDRCSCPPLEMCKPRSQESPLVAKSSPPASLPPSPL
ncbi:hypothetical protein WDU94_001642 [Cyamophila willieti]